MSLYTDVSMGKNSIIVLNPRYSPEKLRELLAPYKIDEERVEEILHGVYLERPITRWCWEEEGIIKTQNQYWTYYIHWGEKITILPNGDFEKKYRNWFFECLYGAKIYAYNIWWGFNKYILKNPWYI